MDDQLIDTICRQVERQFPEMKGVKPRVRVQEPPVGKTGRNNQSHNTQPVYQLTFDQKITTADGNRLQRRVRILANSLGTILKITTSH